MWRETLKYILTDQRQETDRLLGGAILRRHPPGRLCDPATKERELSALARAARLKDCRELLVLTHDEQDEVRRDGVTIRVLPAWRWALDDASLEL